MRSLSLFSWFLVAGLICVGACAGTMSSNEIDDIVEHRVQAGGGEVRRNEKLPGRPIYGVSWFNGKAMTEGDFQAISQLDHLAYLNISGFALPDRSLIRFFEAIGNDRVRNLSLNVCETLTLPAILKISQQRQLVDLSLGGSNIDDSGLIALSKMTQLQRLILFRTPITDAGIKHLGKLKNLRLLDLTQNELSDEGLKGLADLSQLETLMIGKLGVELSITDRGVASLEGLTKLKSLSLRDTQITDESIKSFAKFQHLESLGIDQAKITDRGLERIAQFKNLKRLGLGQTLITNDSVPLLSTMTNLKELWLFRTKVTDEGIASLRKSLPNCVINGEVSK